MEKLRAILLSIGICVFFLASSLIGQAQDDDPTATQYDLLFAGLSDMCQLPCWYDLRIGESQEQALLEILEELDMGAELESYESALSDAEGWALQVDIDQTELDRKFDTQAYFAAIVDGETIEKLVFSWTNTITAIMPIQRVIEYFGEPSEVIVGVSAGGISGYAQAGIWLAYEHFQAYFSYLTRLLVDPAFAHYPPNETAFELCFDQETWIESEHNPSVNVKVENALPADWMNPSETSKEGIFYIHYLEDATDLTIGEFTQLFSDEETPCIQLKREQFVKEAE